MKRFLLSLKLVILFSIILGQDQDLHFEFLTFKDGLSSNHIQEITQDKEGFLWIATADGLNRFDGFNIKKFLPDPNDTNSISNTVTNCIAVDSSDNLWIGLNNTIDKYIPEKHVFIHYRKAFEKVFGTKSVKINIIHFDNKHKMWLSTELGLCLFNPITEQITKINLDSIYNADNIKVFKLVNEGCKVMISSSVGLLSFDYNNSKYSYIEPFNSIRSELTLKDTIVTMYLNTDKFLFTCLPDRIIYLNKQKNNIKVIKTLHGFNELDLSSTENIYEDLDSNIWITTKNGLIFFQKYSEDFCVYRHGYLNPNSLISNELTYIFQDNSGVLWFGTLAKGLCRLNLRKKKFTTYIHHQGNSISGNQVYGLFEASDNRIWIATKFTGINVFDPKDNSFINIPSGPSHPDSLSGYFFSKFTEDQYGRIWSGSWDGGINIIDPVSLKVVRHYLENNDDVSRIFNSSVLCFHQDKDDDKLMWVGTIHGLEKFYPAETLWQNYNQFYDGENTIEDVQIWSILEFNKHLWLATARGLLKNKKGTNNVKWFHHKDDDPTSISSDALKCMYLSSNRRILWLGTEGGGLNKLDIDNEEFKAYRVEEGLSSNVVWGILEDNNKNLWLSTNNGLSKFNPETEVFTNYYESDGLQSNKFNMLSYLKTKNGNMYFGGSNGLTVFNPDSIRSRNYSHKVVLTGLRIFNKPVLIGEKRNGQVVLEKAIYKTDKIDLSYKDNVFSLEFSCLDFAFPKRIYYKYKMEGFDKDWIKTNISSRYATYTNLPPGEYSFLIKASDENGLWSDQVTSLLIKIKPPFWKTVLAYIIYALILLATLFLLRRSVIKRERIMTEIRMEKHKNRTAEEVNQAKLRFYTNISHEFRTPITLINGPVEKLISSGKNMKWDIIQKQLNIVSKNSQKLMNLVNQILDFRKVESDSYKLNLTKSDIIQFVQDIAMSFNDTYLEQKSKVLFNTNYKCYETYFDGDIIQKVLSNLITNAIKYNKEEGLVWVDLMVFKENDQEAQIRIVVRDEGVGIDEKDFDNIFQRYYRVNGEVYSIAEGSGIGLALSKKLIEIHKGRINVESEKGEGSSFILVIPVSNNEKRFDGKVEGNENKDDKVIIKEDDFFEEADHENDDHLHSVKELLIVEDNKDLREFIVDEFIEYKILEAENGEQGLELAISNVPDIIISDIMMPKMNGNEMCKKIKTDVRTSHIPIILLTAKSTEEHIIEGLETGADDYIVKPFSPQILASRVKNLIKNREKLIKRYSNSFNDTITHNKLSENSLDQSFLKKVMEVVEENISNTDLNVNMLADNLGMSRVQLYRKMQALTGQKPVEFIRTIKLKRAADLLLQKAGTVSEIAYQVGFSDPAYFSRCFSKQYKVSPGNYSG